MSSRPIHLPELFEAIRNGDAATAIALQKKNKGHQVYNEAGNSPLHYAILLNKADIAKKLVEDGGADINALGWKGLSPASLAARLDQESMAVFFVEKGTDIRLRGQFNKTVLDIAHEKGMNALKEAVWKKSIPDEIAQALRKAFADGAAADFISLVENHGADIYGADRPSIADIGRAEEDTEIGKFIRLTEGRAAAKRMTEPTQAAIRVLRPLVYKRKN